MTRPNGLSRRPIPRRFDKPAGLAEEATRHLQEGWTRRGGTDEEWRAPHPTSLRWLCDWTAPPSLDANGAGRTERRQTLVITSKSGLGRPHSSPPSPNSSRVGVLFLLPAPRHTQRHTSRHLRTHRSSTATTHRRSHSRPVELRGGIPAGIPRATDSRPTYDHDPPRCPPCRPT